jgi:fumarate reductase flavoprotein subunit
VSINGANRLGSNSLTELLVFGARAGKAAAGYAVEQPAATPGVLAQALDEERRLRRDFLEKSDGKERVAQVRSEMQEAMESGAGIYRTEAALKKSASRIQELRERFRDLRLDDRSLTFNTELTAALELSFMLDLAEAIIESALKRTESRGAHQRTDYPARDDGKFLAHSLAHRNPGARPRLAYAPVKITRWPPGERVYGR